MEWNTSYGFQNDGKHENETDWDDFQIFIKSPAYVYMYLQVYPWSCTVRRIPLFCTAFSPENSLDPPA